jgi:hypothetical protein
LFHALTTSQLTNADQHRGECTNLLATIGRQQDGQKGFGIQIGIALRPRARQRFAKSRRDSLCRVCWKPVVAIEGMPFRHGKAAKA